MPSSVDRYFQEVKTNNPTYSDSQAWATAWSIYCKNKSPGASSCTRPPSEYLNSKLAAVVVWKFAALKAGTVKLADGKIIGNAWRLTHSRKHGIVLEELPVKGKKKLRLLSVYIPPNIDSTFAGLNSTRYLLNENLVRGLSPSDSIESVKAKINNNWSDLIRNLEEEIEQAPNRDYYSKFLGNVQRLPWFSEEKFYLEVTPENTGPLEVQGLDFELTSEWTSFSVYAPNSDFGLSDPYYRGYEQQSPGAARKLYSLLKQNPNVLRNVKYTNLSSWFTTNKIGYKTLGSTWH